MSGYIGSKASVKLVDGYTQAEADAGFVQDPNGAITVSGSNVGIGTSSPDALLAVDGQTVIGDGVVGSANLTNLTSGTPPQLIAGWTVPAITWSPSSSTEAVFTRDGNMQIDILSGENNFSNINFSDPDDEDVGAIQYDHSTDAMRFRTNASERMRIDSAGRVTMPYQPAFLCRPQPGYSITAGDDIIEGTWSSEYNVGNHFNPSGGVFTAPVAGVYAFSWSIFASGSLGTRSDAYISVNGVGMLRSEINSYTAHTGNRTQQIHGQLKLSANDTVTFGTYQNNACSIYSAVRPWSYATGVLIG